MTSDKRHFFHEIVCLWLLLILVFLMQRNYRFFYMFVFSTTLLCLYVFGFSWVCIVKIRNAEQISLWRAMTKTPASIVLIIYIFISVWFVGGLSVFHLYLMSTNQVILPVTAYWKFSLVSSHDINWPVFSFSLIDNLWKLQIPLRSES